MMQRISNVTYITKFDHLSFEEGIIRNKKMVHVLFFVKPSEKQALEYSFFFILFCFLFGRKLQTIEFLSNYQSICLSV